MPRRILVIALASGVCLTWTACPPPPTTSSGPITFSAPPPTDSTNCTAAVAAMATLASVTFTTTGSDSTTLPAFRGAESADVRLEPAVGSNLLTEADLTAGRIVARVTASSDWEPMGLEAGTSYWWVQIGDTASQAYIPAGGGTFTCQPLQADLMDEAYGEPIAIFAADVVPWLSCGMRCCCGIVGDGCLELRHTPWDSIQANPNLPAAYFEPPLTIEQMFAQSGS